MLTRQTEDTCRHVAEADMCLSTSLSLAMSPGPAAARMRHWSCPERLGLELDSDLAEDSAQLCGRGAARCGEAEDVFSRVDLRVRVLAAWEERVLSLRQARRSKQRPEVESCGPAPSDPPRCAAADAGRGAGGDQADRGGGQRRDPGRVRSQALLLQVEQVPRPGERCIPLTNK